MSDRYKRAISRKPCLATKPRDTQRKLTRISARQMKAEVRAGDRVSDEGKLSAPERWSMAFRARAMRATERPVMIQYVPLRAP